jgi:tripartite-type tricarboxylate transporter receptor subunit TctC
MKKRVLCAFLTAIMVLTLAACGPGNNSNSTSSGNDSQASSSKGGTQPDEINWPEGSITLNCGGKAGGSTDLVSRVFAEYLSKEIGVPVVVTNADAIPQIQATHDADADGYTMLTSAMGSFLYGKVGSMEFGIEEMTPIAIISEDGTFGLWAHNGVPYTDIPSFVEYMKAHPDEVNIGMKTGTSTHLEVAGFLKAVGCEANVVDAGGDADRVTALLGKQIDVTVEPYGTMKSYLEDGEAVCLGIFPAERAKLAPDLPTIREQGVDFDFPTNFQALIFPADMDPDLVEVISHACQKVEANADYQKALNDMGVEVTPRTTEEAQAYFQAVDDVLNTCVDYIK